MYVELSEQLVKAIKDLAESEEYAEKHTLQYEEIESQVMDMFKKIAELVRHTEFEESPYKDVSYIDMACIAIYGDEYEQKMTR